MNTLSILVHIHREELNSQGGYLELERSANCKYNTDNLREASLFVCANCDGCSLRQMVLLSNGSTRHLSIESRARICRKVGLSLEQKPKSFNENDTIDPINHEPVLMECALEGSCCFLDCLHDLFNWDRLRTWALQKEPKKQRKRTGRLSSYYLQYHNTKQSLLSRRVLESDMHILDELLGVHIYEYRNVVNPSNGTRCRA